MIHFTFLLDKFGTTTQNTLHSFIMASTLSTHLSEVFCLLLLLILVLLLLFFFPNLVFIIIIIIIIITIITIITIVAKFGLLFQSKCQSETMIKMKTIGL